MHRMPLLAALIVLALAGCTLLEKDRVPDPNRPPEAYLSGGPVDGDSDTFYRVHFHWFGHDPDGAIDHFEYLLTDDEHTGPLLIDEGIDATLTALGYAWTAIERHDLEFVVSADQYPDLDEPADSVYWQPDPLRFHGQHTFFLRSFDNEGAVSTLPAHRTFTATTLAPTVAITYPDDMGAQGGYQLFSTHVRFRWTGADSLQDGTVTHPDSSRSSLLAADFFPGEPGSGLLLDFPDSVWTDWRGWGGEGEQTRLVELAAVVGETGQDHFAFFVQAKDEAGAVTSHYEDGVNLRKIQVVEGLQPTLFLSGSWFGLRVAPSDQTFHFSAPADFSLDVQWSASAAHYGNEIDAYRHGWDIVDPGNDAQWTPWSPTATSTQFSFASDEHLLSIQCRDLSGNSTTAELSIIFVPLTMERQLLFVDDYSNLASEDPWQGWPLGEEYTWGTFPHTDAEQKLFWDQILAEFTTYDPAIDFFRNTVVEETPALELMAGYGGIVWEVKEESGGGAGIRQIAGFRDIYVTQDSQADFLGYWLDAGGRLLLCGSRPVHALLPMASEMSDENYERRQPMAFLRHLGYSNGGPEDSEAAVRRFLPWRHFGIDAVAQPVDQTPKDYDWTNGDWATYRSFWGMDGIRYPGSEQAAFPIGGDWAPADTLRFRPEAYQWFAEAGAFFMADLIDGGQIDCLACDCDAMPPYWGLNEVEVYNWDFFGQILDPPLDYREDQYLPFLGMVPADSTTRWGSAPSGAHCVILPTGQNFQELMYSTGGEGFHAIGVVGLRNPAAPSVLLGFTPYSLAEEEARGLIGHILTDIMALTP